MGNTRAACFLMCLIVLATAGNAQENHWKNSQFAYLEKTIMDLMSAGEVPGLSIAVIRDARVTWLKEFGVANASTKQPVTRATVFEAASLSKPVFAFAVMRLVEKGKLDLDAPLGSYLPKPYIEGDARVGRITTRHVLSHATGFPNWRGRETLKTHFTPGERFSYSGEGFVYLQQVVEHLTDEPLETFIRREVFDPIGMPNSSFVWQDKYEAAKATGHNSAGVAQSRRQRTIEANAAASLHTTASDYAKFVLAIMNRTGLKKSTTAEMLRTQMHVDEACSNCIENQPSGKRSTTISWGLGWGLQENNGVRSFWHWGDNNGDTHAFVMASETQRSGVVILTDSGNGHAIIPFIIERLFGGKQPVTAWLNYEGYNSPAKTLLRSIITGGMAAISQYLSGRARDPKLGLNERATNRLGYDLLNRKRSVEAIEIFKLNITDHPTSGNTYDSLAEAYLVVGEKALALEFYKKAIEVEPSYPNAAVARKIIQELQVSPRN